MGLELEWKSGSTREDAVWLSYLIARANFVNAHRGEYRQEPGPIIPTFAEECDAREKVARIYREMRQQDKNLDVPYFDDLALVADESFIREYVWTFLRQPSWRDTPAGLRLPAFDEWRKTNLADHRAVTKGGLRFAAEHEAAPQARGKDDPSIEEAVKVLQRGEPQRAITDYCDPIIERHEAAYQGKRVYSAQNQALATFYATLPGDEPAVVVDGSWGDAYLLKGYALGELKRFSEARSALEAAVALSPSNAHYLEELAFARHMQGDFEASCALYDRAAAAAEQVQDPATNAVNLTRAWRGQGYCLTERGKLAEAMAVYRKALALDPNDAKSKRELEYIRGLKR